MKRRKRPVRFVHRFYSWSPRPEPSVGLPKCLEGAGQNEVGCRGRRAPVGAARAALGEGGRANLCATTLAVARKSPLELLLRLHATHLAVMGKKRDGWQAVRALPGVPSDSVACDNLVWLY